MTNQHDFDNEYDSEEFLRRIQEFFQSGGEPQEEEPVSHIRRRGSTNFHEELTEEKVKEFKQRMGEIEKELERVLEKFRNEDIPFFFSFMVSLSETEHEREGVWGIYNYNVQAACELMAMMMICQMPHDFSHFVIGSGSTISQMLGKEDDSDSDDNDNSF